MTSAEPAPPPEPLRHNRAFRRLWLAGYLTSMMRWLDMLVLGVFTFDLTDSAGAVAIAFVARMLPRLVFGIPLGALADRVERRVLWVVALGGLAAVAVALTALTASGAIRYWQLLALVFAGGTLWALEFPVRRALIGDVVAPEAIGRAFGVDWTTDSFNRMTGPAIGGAILLVGGPEGAYALMAGVFVAGALVASTLPDRPAVHGRVLQSPLDDLREGWRTVRGSDLLISVLLVTVAFNLVFSPYQSMIPVIGRDILDANALRVGLLSAAEGLGAVLGAAWIATRARPPVYTRLYYFGTMLVIVGAIAFSRSQAYALSMAILFVAGFGFSAFATMQTTILVTATHPALRGRVLGALSLAIGAGPLGALQVGPLVALAGVPATLMLIAGEGLALLLVVGLRWPALRRPSPDLASAAAAAAGT